MNLLVIIATINQLTVALTQCKDILLDLGWHTIIVGDRKTPADFDFSGGEDLS